VPGHVLGREADDNGECGDRAEGVELGPGGPRRRGAGQGAGQRFEAAAGGGGADGHGGDMKHDLPGIHAYLPEQGDAAAVRWVGREAQGAGKRNGGSANNVPAKASHPGVHHASIWLHTACDAPTCRTPTCSSSAVTWPQPGLLSGAQRSSISCGGPCTHRRLVSDSSPMP
jgi:hypothetical protein